MDLLTAADFEGHVGEVFTVAGQGDMGLTLRSVAHGAESVGRRSFSLEFAGPPDRVLPQATYALSGGALSYDIFIVPLGPRDGAMIYQAVFA